MKPSTVDVVVSANGEVVLRFADNIEKVQRVPKVKDDEEKPEPYDVYVFDLYELRTQNRPNLQADILANPMPWLTLAKNKDYEDTCAKNRALRNKLLNESDKDVKTDRLVEKYGIDVLSKIDSIPICQYRQELRDITNQKEWPYNVVWPVKPQI